MLNIYRWGICWIQTGSPSGCLLSEDERIHTAHSSAQDVLIPFWMKNKEMGGKMAGLLVNLCRYKPLHSICFSFHLLAAWQHCLGKEVATERVAGTALVLQSDAGQKSWHLCHRAWIKHGPRFSGGIVPFTTSWGANLFFSAPCFALFSCQLVEKCIFPWYIQLLQHQYKTVY